MEPTKYVNRLFMFSVRLLLNCGLLVKVCGRVRSYMGIFDHAGAWCPIYRVAQGLPCCEPPSLGRAPARLCGLWAWSKSGLRVRSDFRNCLFRLLPHPQKARDGRATE